jgi:Calcineurin-like phosphoesterase
MFGRIRRMFVHKPVQFPPPQPEVRFYAVGDVHGRADLLNQLLDRLDPSHPIVFVGDYADRGENSADVLRRLKDLTAEPGLLVHCLMGNHEDMLLGFLDDPEARGKVWLRNGGLQTLASFGVAGVAQGTMDQIAHELRVAMGGDLIDWLRSRPLFWRSGNVAVVHAGADPSVPIEAQSTRNLIWGHSDFGESTRPDGVWIVHGHRIVEEAVCKNGIISIDTGAYATGRLTAVSIDNGTVEFITP